MELPSLDALPPPPPSTASLLTKQEPKPDGRLGQGPRLEGKTKRVREAAEAIKPADLELPPLPPPNVTWLEQQVRAGELPPAVLDAEPVVKKRGPGRPKGGKNRPDVLTSRAQVLDRIAAGRDSVHASAASGHKRGGTIPTDDDVSAEEWQRVYEAYGATGSIAEIHRQTGVTRQHVQHLLEYGIRRLGLPPIREHATDYNEVNLRTRELVRAEPRQDEAAFLQHLPDIKKAVTERATREAAVAQGLLHSSVQTVDVFLGYVQEVMRRVQSPEGGYMMPEKISVSHIETLSKTANNLSRALDTAVRLSRFTAGEPEANIALNVSHLVCQMTPDELRSYLKTRQLPKHIVNPSGASLTPADEKQLPQVIDVPSDDSDNEPSHG